MGKILLLILLLTILTVSGCAGIQESSSGGYEAPSGYSGHHH